MPLEASLRRDIDPLINIGRCVLAALLLSHGTGLSPGPPGGAGTSRTLPAARLPGGGHPPKSRGAAGCVFTDSRWYSFPGLLHARPWGLPPPGMLLLHSVLQEVLSFFFN